MLAMIITSLTPASYYIHVKPLLIPYLLSYLSVPPIPLTVPCGRQILG